MSHFKIVFVIFSCVPPTKNLSRSATTFFNFNNNLLVVFKKKRITYLYQGLFKAKQKKNKKSRAIYTQHMNMIHPIYMRFYHVKHEVFLWSWIYILIIIHQIQRADFDDPIVNNQLYKMATSVSLRLPLHWIEKGTKSWRLYIIFINKPSKFLKSMFWQLYMSFQKPLCHVYSHLYYFFFYIWKQNIFHLLLT